MSEKLMRYENEKIANHLAHNYVLGTLSQPVRRRVERIIRNYPFGKLRLLICQWEQRMAPMDEKTKELAPYNKTWQQIEQVLFQEDTVHKPKGLFSRWKELSLELLVHRLVSLASIVFLVVVASVQFRTDEPQNTLSYLAVMESQGEVSVVASTYEQKMELTLDILALPDLANNTSYELWALSKTDKVSRSLGVISTNTKSATQKISVAQWRLIKDSHSLYITVEESGGSAIGEPTGEVVAEGLCVQIKDWDAAV